MTCVIAGSFTQASFAQQAKSSNLTQFVNPRIGTGGHGHVFLGANVPFGYVQLALLSHHVAGTGVPVIITLTPYSSVSVINTSAVPVSVTWATWHSCQ